MDAFVSVLPESLDRDTRIHHCGSLISETRHISTCIILLLEIPFVSIFFSRWRATMLRLALCRFFALPRGKILPLKRQELIHLSSFPTLEWSSELCYFCKASNLSELRLEAFGTFLSQTLITYSHNSQPVDSHQQTVPRVTYSPFSPFLLHLPLYSSTASFLVQIDRPVTPSRNLSE